MPELPEVETVRRGLERRLAGRVLSQVEVRRPDLRFPLPERLAERLTGRRIDALRRRAKYLLFDLDDGMTLIGHLGMSGRMNIHDARPNAVAPHEHVVFVADDGTTVTFQDHRRFGYFDLAETAGLPAHRFFAPLGPEPLDDAFTGAELTRRLTGKRTPIKAALLDQRVVAGLGNIYVCEALLRAGISPRRSALSVAGVRAERLVPQIKDVLNDAIAAGGSTLRDYVQTSGELGYFQHDFQAYGREGEACRKPGCKGSVQRIVQSGRSTFFCGGCQR
ncbi:MAG: bifunctional DNA-formamidopyrimidine glycosylase/DNA-(apurinic or apyrimidinic site) lyase [Minwuia sp.]|uniref:bifunctional DNA-formamidopyrimidine glycosylase/DNA-(apurinic or apyrimidinic site) lyase n=1 Tax=Minwuia sp. TaxID=2493630 RepID=UPI003A8676AB